VALDIEITVVSSFPATLAALNIDIALADMATVCFVMSYVGRTHLEPDRQQQSSRGWQSCTDEIGPVDREIPLKCVSRNVRPWAEIDVNHNLWALKLNKLKAK
jgi:hypothetical protein